MSEAELTSIRSPRVKAARQLGKRALRERARLFLAEGPQAAGEALARDGVVTELFLTAAARSRHGGMAARASRQGAAVHVVSGEVMAELAQTVTPQGILAVCRFVDVPVAALTGATPRLVVILANVRDPGNAGTVLRTADAAGARGVVFSDASVDPYNSKCVRASAGSIFHLDVVLGGPVADTVSQLRTVGLRVLAADGRTGQRHGCSAMRLGGCRTTCSRWPTSRSRYRYMGRQRASTWPPRPLSACTPRPGHSVLTREGAAIPSPQRARV
jgi:RNA methyltransferase, TrmH family